MSAQLGRAASVLQTPNDNRVRRRRVARHLSVVANDCDERRDGLVDARREERLHEDAIQRIPQNNHRVLGAARQPPVVAQHRQTSHLGRVAVQRVQTRDYMQLDAPNPHGHVPRAACQAIARNPLKSGDAGRVADESVHTLRRDHAPHENELVVAATGEHAAHAVEEAERVHRRAGRVAADAGELLDQVAALSVPDVHARLAIAGTRQHGRAEPLESRHAVCVRKDCPLQATIGRRLVATCGEVVDVPQLDEAVDVAAGEQSRRLVDVSSQQHRRAAHVSQC